MRRFFVLVWLWAVCAVSTFAQDTPFQTLTTTYPTVYSIAYNADGSRFATLSLDQTGGGYATSLQIWDTASGATLGTIGREGLTLYKFAFNPLQPYLVTTSLTGDVSLWELNTFTLVNSVKGHEAPTEVVFSPDGQYLVTSDWSGIIIWSAQTFEPLTILNSHNTVDEIAPPATISADSHYLAWVDLPATVVVVDLASGQEVATVATGYDIEPYRILFTPTQQLALAYGTLELWDIGSQQRVGLFASEGAVTNAHYAPNGALLVTLETDRGVKLWDVASQTVTRPLYNGTTLAWDVAFSPDSTVVAIGFADGTVAFYKI